MGKLKYYYGTMASGKSATLLMNVYQKERNNVKSIILKPYEERDKNKVVSRVGIEKECITFSNERNLLNLIRDLSTKEDVQHFYIDECQFLAPEQVHQLWLCTRKHNINVYCFGLKTTFKNALFTGIEKLMVYADQIQELEPKAICKYCNEDATTHLLMVNGEPVLDFPEKFEGDTEGAIRFECVCQGCWHNKINKK